MTGPNWALVIVGGLMVSAALVMAFGPKGLLVEAVLLPVIPP